jgi:hypothetical protein
VKAKNKCLGCKVCYKSDYNNICPNVYCTKMLLNGPCGGYVNGNCEVDGAEECAWIRICASLYNKDRLSAFSCYRQPRLGPEA